MIKILRDGSVGLFKRQGPDGHTYDFGAICPQCGCMFEFTRDQQVPNPRVRGYYYVPCPNPECGKHIYRWGWTSLILPKEGDDPCAKTRELLSLPQRR